MDFRRNAINLPENTKTESLSCSSYRDIATDNYGIIGNIDHTYVILNVANHIQVGCRNLGRILRGVNDQKVKRRETTLLKEMSYLKMHLLSILMWYYYYTSL